MDEVLAGSMSPMHGPPDDVSRVMLKEKMIHAIVIDEAVRVVGPLFLWREMQLRPVELPISGRRGGLCSKA
jgi:hypothetical protein